jgi:hypothetical protein
MSQESKQSSDGRPSLRDGPTYRRFKQARERFTRLQTEFHALLEQLAVQRDLHTGNIARLEGLRAELSMVYDEEYARACHEIIDGLMDAVATRPDSGVS